MDIYLSEYRLVFLGPFFPMSRVLPSIPLLPSFHKWRHYWYVRGGFGGHGIYGFHQTFIPAFNSTTVRVKRPDSEGRRIESSKVKFSTYERQTDQINILLVFHHLNCCQPLRSHYCENHTCKLWEETLTNLRTSGAQYSWAHSGFLFPMSRVLPSIPLLPSFHKWGHYWYVRGGFGGHGIYASHQTFIPAFNSTTVRVERPDSEGRRIESSKVKFSTYERKT